MSQTNVNNANTDSDAETISALSPCLPDHLKESQVRPNRYDSGCPSSSSSSAKVSPECKQIKREDSCSEAAAEFSITLEISAQHIVECYTKKIDARIAQIQAKGFCELLYDYIGEKPIFTPVGKMRYLELIDFISVLFESDLELFSKGESQSVNLKKKYIPERYQIMSPKEENDKFSGRRLTSSNDSIKDVSPKLKNFDIGSIIKDSLDFILEYAKENNIKYNFLATFGAYGDIGACFFLASSYLSEWANFPITINLIPVVFKWELVNRLGSRPTLAADYHDPISIGCSIGSPENSGGAAITCILKDPISNEQYVLTVAHAVMERTENPIDGTVTYDENNLSQRLTQPCKSEIENLDMSHSDGFPNRNIIVPIGTYVTHRFNTIQDGFSIDAVLYKLNDSRSKTSLFLKTSLRIRDSANFTSLTGIGSVPFPNHNEEQVPVFNAYCRIHSAWAQAQLHSYRCVGQLHGERIEGRHALTDSDHFIGIPGNSGGPVVDATGKLVAMVVAGSPTIVYICPIKESLRALGYEHLELI